MLPRAVTPDQLGDERSEPLRARKWFRTAHSSLRAGAAEPFAAGGCARGPRRGRVRVRCGAEECGAGPPRGASGMINVRTCAPHRSTSLRDSARRPTAGRDAAGPENAQATRQSGRIAAYLYHVLVARDSLYGHRDPEMCTAWSGSSMPSRTKESRCRTDRSRRNMPALLTSRPSPRGPTAAGSGRWRSSPPSAGCCSATTRASSTAPAASCRRTSAWTPWGSASPSARCCSPRPSAPSPAAASPTPSAASAPSS